VIDLVIKLRELRFRKGLSQREAAEASGLGVKTISSFETGARIESLKLSQLERLAAAYDCSMAAFFSGELDAAIEDGLPPAASFSEHIDDLRWISTHTPISNQQPRRIHG
jgi:transcriptional regulator with XRE-family HTH domain